VAKILVTNFRYQSRYWFRN